MADVEAAGTAPPQAPLGWRAAAAEVAADLRELPALAAEAVVLCFVSAVWANNAALIASIWACCRAAGFLDEFFVTLVTALGLIAVLLFVVFSVLLVVMVTVAAVVLIFLSFAVLLLLLLECFVGSRIETGEIGGDGGAKMRPGAGGRVPESPGAPDRGDGLRDLVVLLFKAVAVGLLILLFAPANGYCGGRVCSMLTDIRCFPGSVHFLLRCFLELFGKR